MNEYFQYQINLLREKLAELDEEVKKARSKEQDYKNLFKKTPEYWEALAKEANRRETDPEWNQSTKLF